MLFSRGVWSIFGVRAATLDAFRAALADKTLLVKKSQLVASARTKFGGAPSVGINPYADPRRDEGVTPDNLTILSDQISKDKIDDTWTEFYGSDESQFSLGDNQYGFWVVINDYEDVTHPKSKAEGLAYKEASKPFKFLSKDEKKVIEANVVASAVMSRDQFPVLIDFNSELVFVASSNVEQVGIVREIITELGGEDYSLAWLFDTPEWPSKFLAAVVDGNKFEGPMNDRAEEMRRFRPEEVEKLDDKLLETIVSSYFAMTELETGQWAGLSTPSRIRLHKTSDPVSAAHVSTAFSVLHSFTGSATVAASVVFQSLDSRFNRKGEEKQYRTDLFTIDVNDNVNLSDAGAALLRGFDIPTFKRDMKKVLKAQVNVPIGHYWKAWLSDMKTAVNTFVDNVTETLKIDKKKYGLKPYDGSTSEEE
jgi:hypothetical protein